MTRTTSLFATLTIVMLVLSACNPTRYAVSSDYEDDDLYYYPGVAYVDEQPQATAQAENENYAEEDYYDENRANDFNQGFYPDPRMNMGMNSGANRMGGSSRFRMGMSMGMGFPMGMGGMGMGFPMSMGGMGMGGMGMGYMMPSNYFYGYSAFGSPMWQPGFNGGFYDPWYDPWMGSWNSPFMNSMCFGAGSNWGMGNMWGGSWGPPFMNGWNNWGNPWGNSFFGAGNNWFGDIYGSNGIIYGPRPSGTSGSSVNSTYGENGTGGVSRIGRGNTDQVGDPGNTTRPNTIRNNSGHGATENSGNNDFDYFRPNTPDVQPARRGGNSRNTGGSTQPNSGGTRPNIGTSPRESGNSRFGSGSSSGSSGDSRPAVTTPRPSSGGSISRPSGGGSTGGSRPSSGGGGRPR